MKYVSFFGGYRVLDDKLYDRVYLAIEALASKEPELDFMFWYTILTGIIMEKEPFMDTCYRAVEDFKKANPDKRITKTLMVKKNEEVKEWQEKYNFSNMFDRCICPAVDKKVRFLTSVIDLADYMICQLYSDILDKTDQKFYQMIEEEKRIMVTSEDTERRIKELLLRFPKRTQYIFDQVNAGEKYMSLAKKFGIGPDVIREKHIDGILNIQKKLAGQKSIFD